MPDLDDSQPTWYRASFRQLIYADILPFACTFIIAGLLTALLPVDEYINSVTLGPSFLVPIVCGGILAQVFSRKSALDGKIAKLVWIPPLLLLMAAIYSWRSQASDNSWRDVWNNFIGTHCGSSECLNEVITAVFAGAVAYSASSYLFLRNRQDRASGSL